ncbi:MAG: tetratricopeptide repeat protein [Acidobacteria bacterium]|nr:tetratricopeptide repeat protein [Acidobacteriota bacterium]MBS1864319.1 tetratricopeptide repeat protein [Acidobacteriota bacterium]
MKTLFSAAALSMCLFASTIGSCAPASDDHLGKVEFPSSCSAAAQPLLEKGAALLHSFQYLQSENTFGEAVKQDPKCALAHWGKAMALYHQLWDFPEKKTLDAGRKELESAKKLKSGTPREKGFIQTAGVFFQKNNKLDEKARIAAYSAALGKWYDSVPGDVEVGSFYALSLVALAYQEDAVKGLELRQKAIAVLNPFFEKNPDHPGVAHYLIHAADEQSLAPQGLAAARRYAAIAPDSSHAIHMPSHIFVRLGMWQDSIASNIAAQAAGARAAEAHEAESHYQTHAMDFLNYSYLQSGQVTKARAVIADEHHVVGATDKSMKAHMDELNERMVMELHHWDEAKDLPAEFTFAKTVASARSGALAAAHSELAQLQAEAKKRAGEKKGNYTGASDNEIQLHKAEAWVAFAEGRIDDALKTMRAAAETEEAQRLDSFNVSAREMLADMLLEAKRPTESLAEYKTALKNSPNRFNLLVGAARAANGAQEFDEAHSYYARLLEMCGSSGDRPELAEARALIAKN